MSFLGRGFRLEPNTKERVVGLVILNFYPEKGSFKALDVYMPVTFLPDRIYDLLKMRMAHRQKRFAHGQITVRRLSLPSV